MIRTIKAVAEEVHKNAVVKGWWEEPRPVPELLCLIHSEVSEALEAYRDGIPDDGKGGLAEELADICIRVFDMAEGRGIDIEEAILDKHMYNTGREYKHGGKKA